MRFLPSLMNRIIRRTKHYANNANDRRDDKNEKTKIQHTCTSFAGETPDDLRDPPARFMIAQDVYDKRDFGASQAR
jgi:hypothetical protein